MDSQRYPHLSRIDEPADLRRVPEAELPAVADELRAYLIEQVSHPAAISARVWASSN